MLVVEKGHVMKGKLTPFQIARLDEYKLIVEDRAIFKSEELFSNSSEYHASIVLTNIIKQSLASVVIYDDNLNGDLSEDYDYYGEFLPSLERHILLGKRLSIVLKNKNSDKESAIFNTLKYFSSFEGSKVDVRFASTEFADNIKQSFNRDIRFAVGDSSMFRYEPTEKERRAYCSFNNKEYSEKLLNAFNKGFSSCEKIAFDAD